MTKDKEYIAGIRLGIFSDTYDISGKVIKCMDVPKLKRADLLKVIKSFEGDYKQKIPPFSAKKLNGKKLYEYARNGISVNTGENYVKIYKISLLKIEIPDIYIKLSVSSGTYIRSIANDIGDRIGCGAILFSLKRIKIGDFSVKNAVGIETLINFFDSYKQVGSKKADFYDKKFFIPLKKFARNLKVIYVKKQFLNALEINTPIYLKMIDFENLNINFLKKGEILAVKIKGIKKTYLHKVLDDFNLCPFSDKNIRLTKYLAKF